MCMWLQACAAGQLCRLYFAERPAGCFAAHLSKAASPAVRTLLSARSRSKRRTLPGAQLLFGFLGVNRVA